MCSLQQQFVEFFPHLKLQCSFIQTKIQISGRLVVPVSPDNWGSTALLQTIQIYGKGAGKGESMEIVIKKTGQNKTKKALCLYSPGLLQVRQPLLIQIREL
jgi:hypothetical protein